MKKTVTVERIRKHQQRDSDQTFVASSKLHKDVIHELSNPQSWKANSWMWAHNSPEKTKPHCSFCVLLHNKPSSSWCHSWTSQVFLMGATLYSCFFFTGEEITMKNYAGHQCSSVFLAKWLPLIGPPHEANCGADVLHTTTGLQYLVLSRPAGIWNEERLSTSTWGCLATFVSRSSALLFTSFPQNQAFMRTLSIRKCCLGEGNWKSRNVLLCFAKIMKEKT